MKAPQLDARAVGDFFVRHGEKLVMAIVGLGALMLIWGGMHALQSLSVTDAMTPEAVDRAATQARGHIDRDAAPPADLLPKREPLADLLDPFRAPLVPWQAGAKPPLPIAAPSVATVLDKPLFDDLAKRSKPEVLPIEDLRAVAGIAVVPAAQRPPEKPKVPERRPTARAADPLAGGADAAPQPDSPTATARIMPYVVVTGLIPVKKQQEEYRRRFEGCSFRDAKRDSPLWCDYEIERGAVGPDGKETWTRIDLVAVAKQQPMGPGDAAAAAGDAEFRLAATEEVLSKTSTPIPFCGPLPSRIDGGWEMADVHPWIVDQQAARIAGAAAQPEQPAPQEQPAAGPGFVDTKERKPPQEALRPKVEPPEYRLFRFVDTAVTPGTTYRYRVRVKVWNPNYHQNPEEMRPHLADLALASDKKLTSPDSKPSTAATVPDTTRILVGTLRADEMKELRIRPGSSTLEVVVLAPSLETGSFALRTLVADPGAVLDVDEKYNSRNQRDRARGEKVVTRRLLVDAMGRQEERRSFAAERGKPPLGIPEPLEVICLRPDGSFEVASIDGSERALDAYRDTLPPRGTKPDAKGPAPVEGPRGDPSLDPLARPGAGT